jgi:hypothetical protein
MKWSIKSYTYIHIRRMSDYGQWSTLLPLFVATPTRKPFLPALSRSLPSGVRRERHTTWDESSQRQILFIPHYIEE